MKRLTPAWYAAFCFGSLVDWAITFTAYLIWPRWGFYIAIVIMILSELARAKRFYELEEEEE